ncbi:MAG: hypothetical protein JSV99_01005 [Planctomycetota bacterium]|nr:MAG: hypothetical protein JSV99_01005 [Planctomycetota bacterium]
MTLFTRLFLADWFVHGIGGALYEDITDSILENYYRVKGLSFGVATATATLPLANCADRVRETVAELKQQLRSLKYNPEKFIEPSLHNREALKSLIASKVKLVQIASDRSLSAQAKKSAWKATADVNEKLLEYTKDFCQNLERKIKLAESKQQSEQLLNYREFFFGLFPEKTLRDISDSIVPY